MKYRRYRLKQVTAQRTLSTRPDSDYAAKAYPCLRFVFASELSSIGILYLIETLFLLLLPGDGDGPQKRGVTRVHNVR